MIITKGGRMEMISKEKINEALNQKISEMVRRAEEARDAPRFGEMNSHTKLMHKTRIETIKSMRGLVRSAFEMIEDTPKINKEPIDEYYPKRRTSNFVGD